MLYLGAFWCGICQRMDETTFSSEEVIALLNAYFVPVRVEDAHRPDIDVRYNENGWPTIVFMNASGDYLAAVNYLSPGDFSDILVRVHVAHERQGGAGQGSAAAQETPKSGANAAQLRPEAVQEISEAILAQADPVYGGYGPDRKFPHCEANEFLLERYARTADHRGLNHVRLTLFKMRESKTHDEEGGFFRYSSKRDWSEPHREKLLGDHAGLLVNALHVFELTRESYFEAMAREIIDCLAHGFHDAVHPYFHGCRDYIRLVPGRALPDGATRHEAKGMFSLADPWLYTDANARTVSAYLRASRQLGREDCQECALETLRFLQQRCRDGSRGMAHCVDGPPGAAGLLADQVAMGRALVEGFEASGEAAFIDDAEALAAFVETHLTNPAGGFFDIAEKGPARLYYPLTLLTENGAAALFFVKLYNATRKEQYRNAAEWALKCFAGNFADYGLHAAEYGLGLQAFLDVTN